MCLKNSSLIDILKIQRKQFYEDTATCSRIEVLVVMNILSNLLSLM